MRRRRRGIYRADPRKQGLAPEAEDGLMWDYGARISAQLMHSFSKSQFNADGQPYCDEEHYSHDDSYYWAKQTRRARDERAAKK